MFTGTAHLHGVTASRALLTVAAVHLEVRERRRTDAGRLASDVRPHELSGRFDDHGAVVAIERRHRRERVHLRGPQQLAAVHVAEPASDVLVEQHLGHEGILVRMVVQPIGALVEVGIGLRQVGAERAESGVA